MVSKLVVLPGQARFVRHLVTFALAGFAIYWVVAKAETVDPHQIWVRVADIDVGAWMAALLATVASFVAVGQYDVLFHRWLKTNVVDSRAARSGMASIALAQTLGFGLVTGTLARWRALPEVSFGSAALVTHYVSISFMVILGVMCALLLPVTPLLDGGSLGIFAVGAVTIACLSALWSLLRPSWLPVHLPPLGVMFRLAVWTIVDVICAAGTFYVLLPADAAVAFAPVFAAFVLALSAGLVSGSPGGLGPFELCLLTLLPHVPTDTLLATVLAFRLIYYVLPATLGIVSLMRPTVPCSDDEAPLEQPAGRAETCGLSVQSGHHLACLGQRQFHFAETSQCLVIIGDPTDAHAIAEDDLLRFAEKARQRCLVPVFYKAPRATAALARKAGWSILGISEEAILRPKEFSLEGASRRQLRRKLRKAETAGVSVRCATRLPLDDMAAIAKSWAARNGGERGFSMGRFDALTIAGQKCFLAYDADRLVAFATFHQTGEEWCLDLMRSAEDACDGTMHALIATAIAHAAREDVAQLSLAAMPTQRPPWFLRRVSGRPGLRQFKLGFAPEIRPLYIAAPTRLHLILAGLDIVLRILRPDSMQPPSAAAAMQKLQTRFTHSAVVKEASCPHLPLELETASSTR